jgi:SagB-type dehydrogenase family enzyme
VSEHLQTVNVLGRLGLASHAQPDPAEDYHEASKHYRRVPTRGSGGASRLANDPSLMASTRRSALRYSHRPTVDLPRPRLGPASLEVVLRQRVSQRAMSCEPVTVNDIATLLGMAYGATQDDDDDRDADAPRRAVPSAGALYPLELYVCLRHVEGLQSGIHHYDAPRHRLDRLATPPEPAFAAVVEQTTAGAGAGLVIITALLYRTRVKYGQRAYRFTLLEAGHVAQNLILAATALGLATVPIGGFVDHEIEEVLGADGVSHVALYVVAFGHAE